MALKWIHNKEIPGFQAVGFILGLKKETAVQKKAELKILMDMGGAVSIFTRKSLKFIWLWDMISNSWFMVSPPFLTVYVSGGGLVK